MRLSELMRQLNELRREVRTETSGWEDGSVEMDILHSLVMCLWQHAGGRAASQWLDCVRNDLIEDSRDSTGDMVHISEAVAEVMGKLESVIAIRGVAEKVAEWNAAKDCEAAGHHRLAAHLLDDPKNGGCVELGLEGDSGPSSAERNAVFEADVDDPTNNDGFLSAEDVEYAKALDGHSVREPDEDEEEEMVDLGMGVESCEERPGPNYLPDPDLDHMDASWRPRNDGGATRIGWTDPNTGKKMHKDCADTDEIDSALRTLFAEHGLGIQYSVDDA